MGIGIVDVHGDVAARPTVATTSFIVLDGPIGNGNVLALQAAPNRKGRLSIFQEKGHVHETTLADRDHAALRVALLDQDQAVALVAPV
jgi:hypothetical protein